MIKRWPPATTIAAISLLIVVVILGGASRQHELRLALTELAALPVLVVALATLARRPGVGEHRFAIGILACVAALPLLQLLPLPQSIWRGLPGRAELAAVLEISGQSITAGPITLTPGRTWRSFLALLPALAMFTIVLASEAKERLLWVQAVLLLTILSVFLGGIQFLSGGTDFYPWATTAAGNVTGFFANRNHFATLCLIGIPFAAILGASSARRQAPGDRYLVWISAIYLSLAILAVAITRSRAGFILAGPVLGCSVLAAWIASGRGRPKPLHLGVIAFGATCTALLAAFSIGPLMRRFDTEGAAEGRFENWPTVANAADTYLPFGSGLGSFDAVFRSVEPLEGLDPTFFNQAHNDYLELWLEAGWFSAALLGVFMVWFVRRSWSAWRAGMSRQRDLQRAATIGVGVVLAHSSVDYPLRTVAVMTLFSLCCGIIEFAGRSETEPGSGSRRTEAGPKRSSRSRSGSRTAASSG